VQATTETLAEQLHAVWVHLMRDSGSALYRLVEELDVSLTQMKTLDALAASEEEPTVKDLAERLGLSLPGMSRNVDSLLRRGFLERREDEHDRRMKRLRVTAEGRDALERIGTARLAGLERFIATLPDEQRDALSSALAPIVEGLRR